MVNLYQPNTLRILGSRLSLSLSLSRNSSTRQLHHRSFPSSISPSPLQLSPLPSIIIRTMSSAQNPNPEPGTSNNNSQEATAAAAATEPHKTPLPLPEPTHASDNNVTQLPVDGEGVRLDHLGPLVVNQDGTTSRIANWGEMAEIEKQNTLRILGKRNKQRLETLRGGQQGKEGTQG
ncbi:uncharacterized protein GGS25DRAFT_483429 [Hypoxylon fragiforme]|uniref:uncharacterized protein n=1 Tax=Hypoxylon fragiforme TaxID=63214 RepID=UPI0020C5D4B1|nr:uncharacterized protein GGS25DRAFT_483429 [Hypoxylon fragiforme]KAI2611619.1 hypothetical protein GGS25DRAFT_483429 [Hypoxylon fragiforme]